jgi:glutaredoxin
MPDVPEVTVYRRSGCHLCDEAIGLLRRYDLEPVVIDIDGNPALAEKFTGCVPVVLIDGKPRFRGRVNEVLLRRLLR